MLKEGGGESDHCSRPQDPPFSGLKNFFWEKKLLDNDLSRPEVLFFQFWNLTEMAWELSVDVGDASLDQRHPWQPALALYSIYSVFTAPVFLPVATTRAPGRIFCLRIPTKRVFM